MTTKRFTLIAVATVAATLGLTACSTSTTGSAQSTTVVNAHDDRGEYAVDDGREWAGA
jgi:ABC-type glycerol-3-phosphate transport system substrate-binding protein